jgi:hypothetical protein
MKVMFKEAGLTVSDMMGGLEEKVVRLVAEDEATHCSSS